MLQLRCCLLTATGAADYAATMSCAVRPRSGAHSRRRRALPWLAPLVLSLPGLPAPAQQLVESFANVPALFSAGWVQVNNSSPAPDEATSLNGYAQGFAPYFAAQAGSPGEYAQVSWRSTTSLGAGTIGNWLITPVLNLFNGMQVTFHTRTFTSPHADRMEVRMSTAGSSTDVGSLPTDVGDFSTLLLEVNPLLAAGGYPTDWTQQSVTVSGLPGPTTGRLAFRYFVTGAGAGNGPGANGNYVGIDTLTVTPVALQSFDAE